MATPLSNARKHPRVLLCEDNGITIMQLSKALIRHGYEVVGQVANAREAVQIAQNASLDLILMDLNLGATLDGIDAAREILADHFVPIVMLTASSELAQIQRAFDAGVCGYLTKPITSERLLPFIDTIISRSPTVETVEELRIVLHAPKQDAPLLDSRASS